MNKKPGRDYIGVGVIYFCHDGQGNFVMAHRNENTRDEHNRWDIGGGGVEFGDKIETALAREIKEEYGTDILKSEFLGFRDVHRNNEAGKTHWVTLDFKVLVDRKKVKNGEPHKFKEVKWFTLDTMPPDEQLHSQLPAFLKKYSDRLK